MSYRRAIRYEPGQALMACSICGMTYLWPSELHLGDDRLYYCTRTCWLGKTYLTDQREQAAAMRRVDDDTSRMIGPPPQWAAVAPVVPVGVTNLASMQGDGPPSLTGSYELAGGPFTAASGDLLLLTVLLRKGKISTISGGQTWTLAGTSDSGSGVDSNQILAVYKATATGSPVAVTVNFVPTGTQPINIIIDLNRVVGGASAGGTSTGFTNAGTSLGGGAIAEPTEAAFVAFSSSSAVAASLVPPAAFTLLGQHDVGAVLAATAWSADGSADDTWAWTGAHAACIVEVPLT